MRLEYETEKWLSVCGAVVMDKAVQLHNHYAGLGMTRRAASMPLKDCVKNIM
jgi:hypothetical protein